MIAGYGLGVEAALGRWLKSAKNVGGSSGGRGEKNVEWVKGVR